MVTLDLKTGASGPYVNIWNETGASAPEGLHICDNDGYYYLLIAEGGTGSGHMVTMGRSKNITGPCESSPHNPALTKVNSTYYFQNTGMQIYFKILIIIGGPLHCLSAKVQMKAVRWVAETALTPVTWKEGE
jgi:beta-xylosidase